VTDLILTAGHHLLVFGLVAMFAAESALIHPGMNAQTIGRVVRLDGAYGMTALLVLAVGLSRVFFGAVSSDYYLANIVFWAKLAAFLAVGLTSIGPTVRLFAWRRHARSDPAFMPPDREIRTVRRYIALEAAFLALILVLAAALGRGYGA